MAKRPNRKHSVIDQLDPAIKDTVEQMLLTGSTYAEIVDYLRTQGVVLSATSVCRYARAYQASTEMLGIAQENFRRMMEQLDRYPDLDTTEAIIRIASQNLLNALVAAPQDKWEGTSIDKLLRETNALIRAAAYKRRVDTQNKDRYEAGLDEVKGLVFAAMSRERPDLYKQVKDYLTAKQADTDAREG